MTDRVVVIGGGAAGLASAVALVERGIRNVTVLEAADLAAGSSSRSAGFIESQYVDPLDVETRARSMHVFRRLQRDHGLEIKETGYLRLAASTDLLVAFAASVALQRELGIDHARVLDAAEVARLVPALATDGVVGGLWGPRDGRIDGPASCRLLASLAVADGARVLTGARVTGLEPRGTGHRVETTAGPVDCEVVIDAAGPWAAQVAAMAGVAVPVVPLRNQIGIWRLELSLRSTLPMVMDYIPHSGARGLYVATFDDLDHVLAGLHSEELVGHADDPDTYDQTADAAYLAATHARLAERMPGLRVGELERAWAGLYPVSPDGLPIVGPVPGAPSVVLAVGGGGSGIQLSPIMGALAADWIAYGEPRSLSDGRRLAPDRQRLGLGEV
jgi:sarcosine oxidase, subunit beta